MDIEELYKKLQKKIEREEFERRVKKKLEEFGGLLTEEGAALIVSAELGVSIDFEKKEEILKISELEEEMTNVSVFGRVTSISEIREFQRRGGVGKVLNLRIMDETGSTRVVLWDEATDVLSKLKRGDILELKNCYTKKGITGECELNLSRRSKVILDPKEHPELPEFKENFLKISEISENMQNIDVVGRIIHISGIREFNFEERVGKVSSLTLKDNTGEIRLTLWNEKAELANSLRRGDLVKLENASSRMGLNGIELSLNWGGKLLLNPKIEEEIELPEEKLSKISEIEGEVEISLRGFVSEILSKRSFEKSDGSKGELASFILKDDSGEIRVCLWNEMAEFYKGLLRGIEVKLEGAYVRDGLNGKEVHLSQGGRILFESNPELEEILKKKTEIPKGLERKKISDLEERDFCEIRAIVRRFERFRTYNLAELDDGFETMTGATLEDLNEGKEYLFKAQVLKTDVGLHLVLRKALKLDLEREALQLIKEIESMVN